MFIKTLYLKDFRLYKDASFHFSEKINAIKGPNAQGKTSLIEAIYFLMTGRSFRTSQSMDLIRHGASFFHIEAKFVKHGIEQTISVTYNGKERKVFYNRAPCASSLNLLGLLQGVVIHPDDAAIVKGAPQMRRSLLDIQIAQTDPLYVRHLTRYDRAMRQRNFLLKAKSGAGIDVFEHQMAASAVYIVNRRSLAAMELNCLAAPLYENICGANEVLALRYKAHGTGDHIPNEPDALQHLFIDQYKRHRAKEMALGATLSGPHKDDLVIAIAGKEAKGFASEGQQRSAVVAMRLAAFEQLEILTENAPLMLVDDLGMSLDSSRREHLLDHLSKLNGQVFITTTDTLKILPGEHLVTII